MDAYRLIHDDCLEALKKLLPNSIDSMVTDPPAGISFMGKEWDKSDGFIPFMTNVMREALRVLKPGAHAFVWAIPRTSHWTATACEEAGFEIRDIVTHIFGSGFPKSHNISKAIDKMKGVERELLGIRKHSGSNTQGIREAYDHGDYKITAPATPEAKEWNGYGTALKPASEHWILVRKPLEKGLSIAQNVLKWGCGAMNIDASRVSCESRPHIVTDKKEGLTKNSMEGGEYGGSKFEGQTTQGRFPANLILSHNEDCVEVGVKKVKSHNPDNKFLDRTTKEIYGDYPSRSLKGHADPDGTETVASYECTEGCAVAVLDAQSIAGGMHGAGGKRKPGTANQENPDSLFLSDKGSPNNGVRFGDSGGASRFFYCAKASKRERNEGCEGLPGKAQGAYGEYAGDGRGRQTEHQPTKNHHPTVKPIRLMQYLIQMITPPNGTVIDPFLGSGSTGVAATRLGFKFIGIEREAEYIEIAKARMKSLVED